MRKLRKPFYYIDEVLARWEMTERDITAFMLADELTLSATVAGVRIQYGSVEEFSDESYARMPEGHRYIIGTIDLWRKDAWRILREGSGYIRSLKSAPGAFQDIEDNAIGNELLVDRADLVICRAEIERFESIHGMAETHEEARRRGAPPRFDWDRFWIEVCRVVHDDGIPDTQTELVGRMARWFDAYGGTSPDESTIKKKLKPLWRAFKEVPDAPAALSRTL